MKNVADCLEVDGTDKAKMTATGQVCGDKTKPYCNVSGISDLGAPSTATCGVVDTPAVSTVNDRYPGEACDDNHGCIVAADPKCPADTKKCPASTTSPCKQSSDCLLGNACWVDADPTKSVCKPQLPAGDKTCLKSDQCKNSQGCLIASGAPAGTAGVCTDYYSLKIDTYTNEPLLCASGMTNGKQKCDHPKFAIDGTADATSNLMSCKPGDPCKYKQKDGTATSTTCACTLSKDGFAWCPLKYDETAAGWIAWTAATKAYYGFDCHTSRRGRCTELTGDSQAKDLSKANVATASFNVFYNAEGCILSIFGDSSRIRMGVFGVISMIFAWFML
jgi:hypothetical protein